MSERMKTLTEPFKIKMVEKLRITSREYRIEQLNKAGYNPFLLHSSDVFIDFLTDSGTGAMSDEQWAGIMIGDESYAGARSWEHLEAESKDLTGMPHILPTHQGRAAERILYGILGGKDAMFISNTHFDTTRANIEFTGAKAVDLQSSDNDESALYHPFKGNINLEALLSILKTEKERRIAGIVMTVTNNSAGGQPVSMENMLAVRSICNKYNIPLIIDGCRIAENSYFIKHREPDYEHLSYREIAQQMLRLGDAFIMSAKKDGLVNIGGLLTIKDEELATKCSNQLIISEGFTTYGGLAGRDMEALAIGLREVFDSDYLNYRIRSTAYLGEHLHTIGIPVILPIGGHAVYIDAHAQYPEIPIHEFPGQALVCDLYVEGGIRSVEVGSVMFGSKDKEGHFIPASKELVRLAIPRRVYTQSHIDYVIEIFGDLLQAKKRTHGYAIVSESPFLRHFTARFKEIE